MSTSLYWRPVPKDPPPSRELSYELKKAIARRLWGHDGSLCGAEVEVDAGMALYLEGLVDAGVPGADELLDAVREHGRVVVWIAQ